MEVGNHHYVHIVEELCLWEVDEEPVKEGDRVGPPRYVSVHYQGNDDELTGHVVDQQRLLANGLDPIDHVLDQHVVDVEDAGECEEQPADVIGEEMDFC